MIVSSLIPTHRASVVFRVAMLQEETYDHTDKPLFWEQSLHILVADGIMVLAGKYLLGHA